MGVMVSYQATALLGTNKCGKLSADSDGYYTVVLGALEAANGNGDYYDFGPKTKALFENSSSFQRMVNAGNLFGEWGHPKRRPGETIQAYLTRCMLVYENNTAFHIRKVTLDDRTVKDSKGKTVIAVIGEIKPLGAMGPRLKEILETKSANCCFSVRALTDDQDLPSGREKRSIHTIVTWDYVIDPGLSMASKFHSPKLESFHNQAIDLNTAFKMLDHARKEAKTGQFKMESAQVATRIEQLIDTMGGSTITIASAMPRSRSW